MAHSYMLCSRDDADDGFGFLRAPMRCFVSSEPASKLARRSAWTQLSDKDFAHALLEETGKFPAIEPEANEGEKHLSLYVHGYNNSWRDSVERYASIQSRLYRGKQSLGVLLLYTWPSDGNVAGYLPDREDARECAPDLAEALVALHDHIVAVQRAVARSGHPRERHLCRAKISVIAHSMGAYVMQKALAIAARRLNSPQLLTLVHQLVLVAADVDNDLFLRTQPPGSDGWLMANLCYRIAALYSGLDQTLGASAGLKHFGTRRLGRSGLAEGQVHDNVFDRDVTALIADTPGDKHSAVFRSDEAVALLRNILIGRDRHLLG